MFKIDIEICETCGGTMKVIASIEDPAVVKPILAHLDNRQGAGHHPEHPPRAPSQLMLPGRLDQAVGSPIRTDARPGAVSV